MLWEWETLVCAHDRNPVLTIGAAALVGAAVVLLPAGIGTAFALVALGGFGVAALASRVRRAWCAARRALCGGASGRAGAAARDAALGFAAIVFLFAVVWVTDIAAYFAGRAIGGPKLMPRVSPNKTWSGAIGGTVGGVIGGVAGGALRRHRQSRRRRRPSRFVLSVVAQAGDLFESAIKRRFDAKDASQLIPGHGGLMDRLDGFVIAALVAALIGVAHGGVDAPARGLLVW